ncbi:2',3'-cyclic-nucleotide 3'-phosphodiesterase [Lindgomyces ingoldianus]|uniref:2',3'-cyclic-nucleotide 3'-phosphodiesterase n=1 Tax=Lindgomyces ingoldianus TaxID=673940 RepID=A0ACB6QYF7_9PLEO|nr:2',3'-cyclic-nucleotide 3'-phosphodiesterase [Lindgomyces ingoldianus]KAF2472053.1 2',3'-cyclic-nucleotide 3'-phosphodiesterase [Lindgomyces ingoldianus]
MPGSSLWLLPPADHPLNSILSSLIQETSSHFNSPQLFIPHITLTSEISPSTYLPDPQAWLDHLKLPAGKDVRVKMGRLQSEDVFVRKLYSKVEKQGVVEIAKLARTVVAGFNEDEGAQRWANEKYGPHLSLLYHDCPKIAEDSVAKIEQLVRDSGVGLDGEGELAGWTGGRVVLVPTDRPIKEWNPLAERKL